MIVDFYDCRLQNSEVVGLQRLEHARLWLPVFVNELLIILDTITRSISCEALTTLHVIYLKNDAIIHYMQGSIERRDGKLRWPIQLNLIDWHRASPTI